MDARKARQKTLAQDYKKQPKKLGAYCIRNMSNSKCFIGVSRDLDARLNRHRFELRLNSEHVSADLQSDWNSFGCNNSIHLSLTVTINDLPPDTFEPRMPVPTLVT